MSDAASSAQRDHYEAIHDAYEAHYYDASSMEYRRRFIYEPLFSALPPETAVVADLACGSGHNSLQLKARFPRARTIGYDISEAACRDYERRTGESAHCIDLTAPVASPQIHDAALVVGGLHHCVSDLDTTLRNIARMVRPGGHFLMMEPNDDFLLSGVRRWWYRNDRWFEAETEAALKHGGLIERARPWFEAHKVAHFGGPAFYLILNSLITRVPLGAKPGLSRVLFPVERAYNLLPGRAFHAAFLAVWRRTDAEV